MGLMIKFEVSCDRCGYTLIYSFKGIFDNEDGLGMPEGWAQPYHDDKDLLCPDCLKLRQEVLGDYFNGRK
jgi:hypothetical protein